MIDPGDLAVYAGKPPSNQAELLAGLDVLIRTLGSDDLLTLTGRLVGRVWEARQRLARVEARPAERVPVALGPEPDLTSEAAAKLLGASRWMVWKLAREGKLPGHYRVGRVIRVPLAAVEALRRGPGVEGGRL